MLQSIGRYSLPRVAVLLLVLLALSPGAAPAVYGAPSISALPARATLALPAAGFSLCFPYAPKQASGSAILAIANPGAAAAVLQVNYTKPDGSAGRAPQVLNLGPGATALLDLAQDANLPAGAYQVIARFYLPAVRRRLGPQRHWQPRPVRRG